MTNANEEGDLPDAIAGRHRVVTRHFHQIYNPAELKRAIEQLEGEATTDEDGGTETPSADFSLSSEDTNRLRQLKRIAADTKGHRRRSIVGSRGMASRIEALSSQMPHFAPVIDLVGRAALVSARTATPMRLPPVLCLGEAGIGKTYTIKRLAEAVGGDFALIAATLVDAFRLRGLNTAWKGARIGRIAEILINSTTSPIIVIDEYDKAQSIGSHERPYDIYHDLLERENSCVFRDDFCEIEFDASHATYFLSANSAAALPSSILDRLLVLEIPSPNRDQLRIIAASLYAKCRDTYSQMLPERLAEDLLDELARHNPRRISRILDLAVGFAAAAGRRHLNGDDVRSADRLAGDVPDPDRKGFRGPVGFTRHGASP